MLVEYSVGPRLRVSKEGMCSSLFQRRVPSGIEKFKVRVFRLISYRVN